MNMTCGLKIDWNCKRSLKLEFRIGLTL